jgi:PAS domain S-box-containing protein
MCKLSTGDNLSRIQNKSLGNDFINELIIKHNIAKFFAFFDANIVLIDNIFSKDRGQEINGIENIKEYFETLFLDNPEIFRIKSRELKVVKLADKIYHISISLKGVFCENNKNSILKVKLKTIGDNNNHFLINSITLYSIDRLTKESNKMNGGLISFSLDKFLSIKFISEELLSFLKYEHKGEMISDLDGRLSSAMCIEDTRSLKSTINDSNTAKTYFKTSISIKNAMGNYINVILLGQSLMFQNNKHEVFAIICEETFDIQIQSFSDNISSQLISLAQSYSNPIFWKDTLGKFLGCNVSFLEKFHINSVKDLINKDDSNFFDKEIVAKHLQENQRLIIGDETQLNSTESFIVDDHNFYINLTKVPLYRKGSIVGIIGFALDVTMEEKLKQTIVQQEAEINLVFALSSHGYFIKDSNLKFLKVNKVFCDIVNISMEEIIGKSNEELLIYGLDASLSEQEILKTKKKVSFIYIQTMNKGNRYFTVTENPLLDEKGELIKIIGNVIDTTDEINNKKKLKKDYHRLISVFNEKHNISFITVDMNTKIITSYAQKGSTHNIVGLVYAENLIKYNASKFLYKKEQDDFLHTFSYNSLIELNKSDKEVKRIYTIKRYDNTLNKVLFTVDFNINPFTSHLEATIKSTDITESQFALEVVNSFDMREYDFIVRLSTSIDTFIVIYSDTSQYDFRGYENDNSVDKFLDVLFKNTTSKRPKKSKWINDLRECFKPHAEWNFDIDTNDGLRKNIIVRPLNEEKQSVIIVSQDITVRTKHNIAIQQKLEKLANEAVTANNVKTDFLARMSHDMRTPLSAIMGLTDFGISESKDENLTNYFEKIKNSGEYLKTLLNDVLDMQVIEKGNLVLKPQNVLMQEKIKNVKTIIQPRALEKNITLTINKLNLAPSYISIDAQRAEQVLVNLLTNALKYTNLNGHIDWIIEFIDGDAPFVRHIIKDDGVGMSKNFQKHMFDSFSREDNIFSSAEGGSGIGLAIVKNIIDVMGGKIRCESELGVGTTFEVELPVAPITKEQFESNLSKNKCYNSKLLKNRKILVCEDNSINIVIIQKILSQYNMSVDVANNGELGVKYALDNYYDAILMDIRMPVMNGLDAAKEIRLKNKSIPIIAISANAYEKDIEQSLSCGMNAHLSKPINKDDLFYTLARLLDK